MSKDVGETVFIGIITLNRRNFADSTTPCHFATVSDLPNRTRTCGAVYARSEALAIHGREIGSFQCSVCDKTLETWNSEWVPAYKFLALFVSWATNSMARQISVRGAAP